MRTTTFRACLRGAIVIVALAALWSALGGTHAEPKALQNYPEMRAEIAALDLGALCAQPSSHRIGIPAEASERFALRAASPLPSSMLVDLASAIEGLPGPLARLFERRVPVLRNRPARCLIELRLLRGEAPALAPPRAQQPLDLR